MGEDQTGNPRWGIRLNAPPDFQQFEDEENQDILFTEDGEAHVVDPDEVNAMPPQDRSTWRQAVRLPSSPIGGPQFQAYEAAQSGEEAETEGDEGQEQG
jgi:hypothetical protein